MSFREGEFILLVYEDKRYLKRLTKDFSLNVGKDVIRFTDIVDKPPGSSYRGFCLLKPTLEDIILLGFERKTQIVYPKDSFYIAFKMLVNRDSRVLEFGTGSGAFTAVLSHLANEVWTYEARAEFYSRALKNWEKFGLCKNVKAFHMDFLQAELEESFFDGAFVDVKDPTPYIEKVWKVLRPGAILASLLPTANQLSSVINKLKEGFCSVEVLEILHRYYKTNPERIRPKDTMVGHTGYVLFARKRI